MPASRQALSGAQPATSGDALREAARASGLQVGDPMSPLVDGLAVHADHLDVRQDEFMAASAATVDELRTVIAEGRETAEAEAARFRAECQATEAETIAGLAGAIAKASAQALDGRVGAMDRLTAVLVGLVVTCVLALGSAGGWWVGDRSTRESMDAVEDAVRATFRADPASVALWVDVMRWNDLRAALTVCREPSEVLLQGGRRACRVPLWVERPPKIKR